MWRLIVLFGCVTGAAADLYAFKDEKMPGSLELQGRYYFHVQADAGPASVTFKNFEVEWSAHEKGIHKHLHVSLIPWSKFDWLVDPLFFCSAERSLVTKQKVPTFTVGLSKNATIPIKKTDVYLLTVTNCGDRSYATIKKGEVIVKQVHGHLPGNKTFTFAWWLWFSLINLVLCIMWIIALARHYKALLRIHKMIAAAAVAAFVEAAASYFQYMMWNMTGSRSLPFQVASMFFYAMKYVVTLRMLIETVAGSGITMERLEVPYILKMDITLAVFMVTQWIWKSIISYKYLLMLDSTFLLLVSIPGTLFWLGIFVWVYRQFHVLLTKLQDKKLASDAVKLFTNMRIVLVGSLLLATVVLLLQFSDLWLANTPWELQWVPYDGAPHAVYTLFFLALMILWWPHADSWKLGYSEHVNQDENETGGDANIGAQQIGAAEETEVL